jgi:hypothetical protein
MMEEKTAVSGIYDSTKQAELVVPGLLAAGLLRDAIVIAKAPEGTDTGIRLTVHSCTEEEVPRAKDVLKNTGAKDISSSAEKPDQAFVES